MLIMYYQEEGLDEETLEELDYDDTITDDSVFIID